MPTAYPSCVARGLCGSLSILPYSQDEYEWVVAYCDKHPDYKGFAVSSLGSSPIAPYHATRIPVLLRTL